MGRIPEDQEEVGSRGIVSRRTDDVYMNRSVKKEKSEILSKNDVSGTKNTRDATTQESLTKKNSGGGGGIPFFQKTLLKIPQSPSQINQASSSSNISQVITLAITHLHQKCFITKTNIKLFSH
jgi:hypothetical protein